MSVQGPVSYQVALDAPRQQLKVRIQVEGVLGSRPLHLFIPSWVPGAYALMRYGRNLIELTARDGTTGKDLPMTRQGWSGWDVQPASTTVVVEYRAAIQDRAWGELTGLLDSTQAILLGTSYLRVDGFNGPVEVAYVLPEGWPIHHPAGASAAGPNAWKYPSYERMMDTPITAGRFETHTRHAHGKDFHFVFLDRCVGFERLLPHFLDQCMRAVDACHTMFGAFPFENYTTVASFSPQAHWGLEHASSTMVALGELAFIDAKEHARAVRVFAHELFHAWNVCSLKPVELMLPDLEHGSFTNLLWVAEGVTRYYEFLLSSRAREIPPEAVLSNLVNFHRELTLLPAFAHTSAGDSSYASFLNHHRYAGAANTSVDYYDFGMLVSFELDMALQDAGSSLDAAFAQFYRDHVKTGYTQAQFTAFMGAITPAAKTVLDSTLEKRGVLHTVAVLEKLGFKVEMEDVPYLGIVVEAGTGPGIGQVLDTSPAARAGVAAQDDITRVNGFPYALKTLQYLVAHENHVTLECKRGHTFLQHTVPVERRQRIGTLTWNGSAHQAARVRTWLGRDDLDLTAGRKIPLTSHENFHGIPTTV